MGEGPEKGAGTDPLEISVIEQVPREVFYLGKQQTDVIKFHCYEIISDLRNRRHLVFQL